MTAVAAVAVALTLLVATPSAAAATPPSAPRNVQATPGAGSVLVRWQAPARNGGASINKYRVARWAPGIPLKHLVVGRLVRSLRVTGLRPGTAYRFRVQAHNARGWSPVSTTVSAIPKALAGFGTIQGRCGRVAPQLDKPTPSLFGNRSLDFKSNAYDDPADRSRLTPGGVEVIEDSGIGGSSLFSRVFAYEVLARCERATLLKTQDEITYTQPSAGVAHLLVRIAGSKVGVSVARAFTFPFGEPMTPSAATTLLTNRLEDVNHATQNVTAADAWVKHVLVVMAVDQQHADTIAAAWAGLDADLKADTVVYVVVTHGNDDNIYVS